VRPPNPGSRASPQESGKVTSLVLLATGVTRLTHRRRTHAHKEFSFACCAAVSCTTFLGLQFQMDCVGSVSFLS